MKSLAIGVPLLASALAACALAAEVDPEVHRTIERFARARPDARALAFYSLDWAPDLKEALARARRERRPVFLIANTNITAGCNFYTGHT